MQHQRIEDEHAGDGFSEEHTDSVVLDFMLCGPSWPWSMSEIARELGQRTDAEDAVRRLTETGLVHRFGDFVFPTRTARRASELPETA
jgi:hypothetical protein